MVAGTVALLCELNPALKTKQPIVKSILAAGAGAKTRNYETIEANFKIYGAGIVDALAASYIVDAKHYSTATGILSGAAGASKSYSMYVTSSDTRMRVALAYSNRINIGSASHSSSTSGAILDGTIGEVSMTIYDPRGMVVAIKSASTPITGANLKVAEFNTNGITGSYTIKITLNTPASGSRPTNFGVAWW